MIWQIFVFGFLALLSADILGCLFNGGRITAPVSGGGKKLSLGAFTQHHTALNLFRAVVIGALVGLAHWWPQHAESPLLGCIFHVVMMVLLIWSTFWFLRHAKAWSQMLWYAILATAIILAAQHASRIMSLWWESRVLSWIFCVVPWLIFILVVGFAAFVLAWRFYRRTTGKGWKIVAVVIAILAIVAMVLVIIFGSQITGLPPKPKTVSGTAAAAATSDQTDANSSVHPPAPTTPTESKQDQITRAVNNLTVSLVTPEELEQLTVDKYSKISEKMLESSLTLHDQPRTEKTGFSDALTYGFKSDTDKGKFAELQEEILRNPIYGVTVANALRDKKIGDKTLGDINPWMDTMCEKNAQNGVAQWCDHRGDDERTFYVTAEYRRYAASLCTFLERLVSQGVQERHTAENWCLNNTTENNKRAGVLSSKQYTMPALILAYVTKSQMGTNEGLLIVGFNVHDKRPEFYGEEDTPELPNAPSNPEGGTPSNPSNPDTPDNPSNPDTPTPTTPETPTYNKDKSLSDNSGTNDNQGPGPDTNNGEGANGSSADVNGGNGTPSNYAEEEQRHENDNAGQRTGGDSSTPSHNGGGTVDNNGADADNPSSQGDYEPELPGGSGSGRQHWDGA